MDLESLAQLAELISGIAVVVSLVYLAYEVKRNTKAVRMDNYARVLDRMAAMQSQLARDGPFAAMFGVGVESPDKLTSGERVQFTWCLYEFFGAFEFILHGHQQKVISDEIWRRWSATISFWCSFPGVQAWWENRPAPFTEEMTRFVDEILQNQSQDTKQKQSWASYVRGAEPSATPEQQQGD